MFVKRRLANLLLALCLTLSVVISFTSTHEAAANTTNVVGNQWVQTYSSEKIPPINIPSEP